MARKGLKIVGDKKGLKIDGGTRKLIGLMIKMILSLAQGRRDTEGAVFDTLLGESGLPEVATMEEQCTVYQKKAVKGHSLGPPHIWVFGALLAVVVKRCEAVAAANLEVLKEFLQTYESADVETKADPVRFCRVSKFYNHWQKRIILCLARECGQFRKALMGALVEAKFVRRQGRAPATLMERELQEWLERLLKQ